MLTPAARTTRRHASSRSSPAPRSSPPRRLAGAGVARRRPASTLVQLRPRRGAPTPPSDAAGATLVAPAISLYRLPTPPPERVVPLLRARGALAPSTPNRPAGTLRRSDFADPLVPTEWWRAAVGVDALTPPGPGRAGHDRRLGRRRHAPGVPRPREPRDAQRPGAGPSAASTARGSHRVIGAPVNGLGLVGIYPEAVLRSYDAAIGEGTRLDTERDRPTASSPPRTAARA